MLPFLGDQKPGVTVFEVAYSVCFNNWVDEEYTPPGCAFGRWGRFTAAGWAYFQPVPSGTRPCRPGFVRVLSRWGSQPGSLIYHFEVKFATWVAYWICGYAVQRAPPRLILPSGVGRPCLNYPLTGPGGA